MLYYLLIFIIRPVYNISIFEFCAYGYYTEDLTEYGFW